MSQDNNAKETVVNFLTALNEEDFESGRKMVNDDLSFVGVLGSRSGAEIYFEDMKRMKIKYRIQKVFADGDEVCVLCDFLMDGVAAFGCALYQMVDGKISSIRVVFDPRPVLESAGK